MLETLLSSTNDRGLRLNSPLAQALASRINPVTAIGQVLVLEAIPVNSNELVLQSKDHSTCQGPGQPSLQILRKILLLPMTKSGKR